jgi:hypothetical protein
LEPLSLEDICVHALILSCRDEIAMVMPMRDGSDSVREAVTAFSERRTIGELSSS